MSRPPNDPHRREKILQATLDTIAEHGIHAVTHRKIATCAGVPLGSMTYYFDGMEPLLEEAFTWFTLGMTVGRFTGGWFIDRYSRVAVVRASALLGGLGIAMIVFVDVDWIAGVSVILWGLGASLGFPLTISAASDTGPDAPTRVSVVATTGYLAFLVGPPLLGFLGEHYGLRSAMLVVLGLVIIAALVARAVAKPETEQTSMEKGYER